jgi:hypothetical protein
VRNCLTRRTVRQLPLPIVIFLEKPGGKVRFRMVRSPLLPAQEVYEHKQGNGL